MPADSNLGGLVTMVKRPEPPAVKIRRVHDTLHAVMGTLAATHIRFRELVTDGWENEKPRFVDIIGRTSSGVFMEIRLAGSDYGRRKWIWLSFGTKVRYATMTDDFRAKTHVRVLGSGAGRGGVAFVNTRKPNPGIKAREWDKLIREKTERKEKGFIQGAVTTGLQAGGSISSIGGQSLFQSSISVGVNPGFVRLP